MYKLFNHKALRLTAYFGLFVYVCLLVSYSLQIGFGFSNNDNYVGAFKDFIALGYYNAVANGTSILYNTALNCVYYITGDIKASFILINGFSQLFILIFGCKIIFNVAKERNIYFYIILGNYILFSLNQRAYLSASNDTFLGVFTILFLYFLIFEIFKNNRKLNFISLGVLLAICASIRPTAIYLFPILIFVLIVWIRSVNDSLKSSLIKVFLLIVSFVSLTLMLHYPSLKEKNALSFYNKVPTEVEANWMQRNYLGWKKIENNEEQLNRDAIWIHTKFDAVEAYLDENGSNSLPKTYLEFLQKDPILLVKIGVYNVVYSIVRYARFWGFLFFIIPFIFIRKQGLSMFNIHHIEGFLFFVFMSMLSITCIAFIEMRWFIGYEVLIPVSILYFLNQNKKMQHLEVKNVLFICSILIVTLFNLRSIYTYF